MHGIPVYVHTYLCMHSYSSGTSSQPVSSDCINSLRLRQNGRHFADDIFKCIFLNKNVWILIKISLKFVPLGPITNIPALVQIMAWCRPGDKPLFGPMMVRLPMYICVTRPQWVKLTGTYHYSALGTHVDSPCCHHDIEKVSMLLALCKGNPPVTSGFPSHRPVMQSFDVFFDVHLNKWLDKQ